MTWKGTIRGKTIELEEVIPWLEGQRVDITLQPAVQGPGAGSFVATSSSTDEHEDAEVESQDEMAGSPALLLKAMHEPPHVDPAIVDELERLIEESKMPVRYEGIFDADTDR